MTVPANRSALIIGGPTASGKTELALALAERFDAEIVGADSRQIYRDMPIGTAAPTPEQRARVRHWLVGFLDPYERYSAARYVEEAAAAIADIHARGKRAIVVGGTGFYLRALCGEVDLARGPDPAIRARLAAEARTHPIDVLHDWLRARDPRRAAGIATTDAYRVVRALEISLAGTPPATDRAVALPTLRAAGIRYLKAVVRLDAAELAERIARRTDAMLEAGLVAEAERIGAGAVAADAVGYRDALAYSAGRLTYAELRELLARATRGYAKRQRTWFRSEPDVRWLAAGDVAAATQIAGDLGWTPTPPGAPPPRPGEAAAGRA